MTNRLLLLLLCACAPATASAVESRERPPRLEPLPAMAQEARCTLGVLATLGWRFASGDGERLGVHGGPVCTRADLADARARGDLRATLPRADADSAQLATDLEALLEDPATHCAYSMQLGTATRRAVGHLVANDGFRFSALQTGWIGFGATGAGRDGWRRVRAFGRGYVPAAEPSRAIAGFYTGKVRAECGVGRQIAQYATLHELFGADGFDATFAPDEIAIGTFVALEDSESVLLGRRAGRLEGDPDARRASALGRHAFAGRPGFIVHVFDWKLLDDINNQAENFVVHEVSPAAADALAAAGGFAAFNRRAHEFWELSVGLGLTADRIHERLFFERDATLRAALPASKQATIARMQAILDDPFFQGFQVYVHPKGVKPVAYHFARLLDRNPRTPFRIELAGDNLHTTIWQRWVEHLRALCVAAQVLR